MIQGLATSLGTERRVYAVTPRAPTEFPDFQNCRPRRVTNRPDKRKALRAWARRAFALNDQRACFSAAIRSSSGGCDMNKRLKPPAGEPEMPKAAI